MPISVNGQRLEVTENLFEALCKIKSSTFIKERLKVPSPELLLWIDTISIDQRNAREKSEQVPQMGGIYSSHTMAREKMALTDSDVREITLI